MSAAALIEQLHAHGIRLMWKTPATGRADT